MIEPIRHLRTVHRIFRAFQNTLQIRSAKRPTTARRRQLAALAVENLEERVVPAIVTGLGDLQFIAGPGEANDVHITPGFLTFISDSSQDTVVQTPPGFSSNWLAAISASVGVSLGVELSVSVPVINFLLAQNGIYFPSIPGASDAAAPVNFAGSVANAASQAGASIVGGAQVTQGGNVFYKVTGSSTDVIDDYEMYQVVADPGATLNENSPITDINSALFKGGAAGLNVTGSAAKDETDSYVFNAQAGKRYVVMLDADPDHNGKLTSTDLKFSDLGGFILGTPQQENLSVSGYNAIGAIDVTTSGPRFIQVKNTGFGTDTSYRFVVLEVDPNNDAVAEASPNFASTDTPKAIPDFSGGNPGVVTSTIHVSNFSGVLTDVNALLNISHSFDQDLIVKLTSPQGTTVTLIDRVGGGGANFTNTTLDDNFSFNPIGNGSAPFSSTFAPSNALSAFNGEDPNGDWTLTVSDNEGVDTGTLNNWSLQLSPTTGNDSITGANALSAGKFGKGQISPAGEVDYWKTENVTAGSVVYSYVDTNHSTKNKDSQLTVLANDGTVMASDDNSGPPGVSQQTLNNLMGAFSKGGVDLNALSNTTLSGVVLNLGDRDDKADASTFNTGVKILAGTGNDDIIGSQGDDIIDLGDGDDTVVGNAGNDTISGGAGDDVISGGAGDDNLDGGDGNDTFIVNSDFSSTDQIKGGDGLDLMELTGSDAGDTIIVSIDHTAANYVTIDINGTVEAYQIPADDVEQLHIIGGTGFDHLIIKDVGLGANDVVQYFKGADGTSGLIKVGSNKIQVTFDGIEDVNPLDGPLTRGDHTTRLVVYQPDPFEVNGALNNDTRALATFLGSGVINVDPTIAIPGDVDFYQVVAADNGLLDFRVFFEQNVGLPGNGNLDIQVLDINGNVIGSSTTTNNEERVQIPAVQGQVYYLKVFGATGVETNSYDMSIINTPAPSPKTPVLDPDNDSGASDQDLITQQRQSMHYFIHADLAHFADQGITILTPAQAAAGVTPGVAIEVFDNDVPMGFASAVLGTSNTIFEITFDGNISKFPVGPANAAGPLGYQGFLNFVTAAVVVYDPLKSAAAVATPAVGRTLLSAPLNVTIDQTAPLAPIAVNLLDASDTGTYSDDNVTKINTPGFNGIAEANTLVRIRANGVVVGQAIVGSDATDNILGNGLGAWNVITDPLDDGTYDITATVEDAAGVIGLDSAPLSVTIDTVAPDTPYLDLVDSSDTGRNNQDNVTKDNTPTLTTSADDVQAAGLNLIPHDVRYRIFERDGTGADHLLVNGFPGLTTSNFFTDTLPVLADGVHNLKLEVEDRAGNISHAFLLQITIDTQAPVAPTITLDPASGESGVASHPATYADRITNITAPGFVGTAEANAIVRLFADGSPLSPAVLDGSDIADGLTVAVPVDGNLAFPNGQWSQTGILDLNNPGNFTKDGVRQMGVTAEDLAGNVSVAGFLNMFVDTQGPQVTGVQITAAPTYDLFDPKPVAGPTPRIDSLTINFQDLPNRDTLTFANYQALLASLGADAAEPGHYVLTGDANGIIPVKSVTLIPGGDVNGVPATLSAVLAFSAPLPDDRFTLTIDDAIYDAAGNRLDGESNAREPQESPDFPSGDGTPGGAFVARFTVDSRPEIGSIGQGGVTIDINGNMQFDPTNTDFTNRDLAFEFGVSTDRLFAGQFAPAAAATQDGFDRLGAYGYVSGKYRWLLDFTNDGRPDFSVISGVQVNGTPISGDFNPAHPGDEIGLFDGKKWYFDTNNNNNIDAGDLSFTGTMVGLPITGDFDGDGKVDIAVQNPSLDTFFFDLSSAADGTPGVLDGKADYSIKFDNPLVPGSTTPMLPGVLERPFAADFNLDGITDIGLMVPHRDGASPTTSTSEVFIIQSVANLATPGTAAALNHQFSPTPLGNDLYAQFGTNVSVPIVGNFDPPVVPNTDPGTGSDDGATPTVTLTKVDVPTSGIGGTFRVERTGSTTQPLAIELKTLGSAKYGKDYSLTVNGVAIDPRSVLIPADQASIDIVVHSLATGKRAATKTVTLKLVAGEGYQISTPKLSHKAAMRIGKSR